MYNVKKPIVTHAAALSALPHGPIAQIAALQSPAYVYSYGGVRQKPSLATPELAASCARRPPLARFLVACARYVKYIC